MNTYKAVSGVAWGVLLGCIGQVNAFQLSPDGTLAEREMAKKYGVSYKATVPFASFALHNFSDPAHEALTQKIYGCDGDWQECSNPNLENAGAYIIAGVRWNDDPVFMPGAEDAKTKGCDGRYSVGFISQTRCWVNLFEKAESKSASDPMAFMGAGNYISRSHFGDLQFLHSMASQEGVAPEQTKREIMMWAEFAWGVADGTYPINTYLKDIKIEGWDQHFNNGQTVQDLFAVGRPWLRANVNQVALGSLLHLVQDSFAGGHAQRREEVLGDKCMGGAEAVQGRIEEFHSYARQDHAKHKADDASSVARIMLMAHEPDVVDAGKKLRGFIADRRKWADVRPYLDECVFALANETTPASAGDGYKLEANR
ncbi:MULTISPECIES: hypothetical protein [unclassified Pseudomonas]|uniref:hypothetical protein n=1 Tax=unclassified Pseudomonas TaxID=196821 RepID=UPI000871A98F|nr:MULTISPECIES: hypothetical protein [unclassified Pseudomonas]SCW34930.1 hypothetical protein SAMN03159424_00529 [Pseudomonas sp. NFACC05-1]SDW53007.1 hypothetical protein SAMN03159474_01118 [Pseudomonas sp. NFACC08-1]